MENRTKIGANRTGMAVSPAMMPRMQELTEMTMPTSEGDDESLGEIRLDYIAQADPVGSVPPPLTAKGLLKSGMKAVQGKRAHVFLDKLGERLAFERTGTRLYEAFIMKCSAPQEGPSVVELATLRHFADEEAQHFKLVVECIQELGG